MTPDEMEAVTIEAMHTEDYTYPPLRFAAVPRGELAALRAELNAQQVINDLLRLENETLGANLAREREEVSRLLLINERLGNEVITCGLANDDLRARIAELEAMLIRGSETVYDLIGELADATGLTRAELEIAFLGEAQP